MLTNPQQLLMEALYVPMFMSDLMDVPREAVLSPLRIPMMLAMPLPSSMAMTGRAVRSKLGRIVSLVRELLVWASVVARVPDSTVEVMAVDAAVSLAAAADVAASLAPVVVLEADLVAVEAAMAEDMEHPPLITLEAHPSPPTTLPTTPLQAASVARSFMSAM